MLAHLLLPLPVKSGSTIWLHAGPAVASVEIHPRDALAVTVTAGGKVIWRGIKRDWRPWKLQVADVDADGKPEFIVGLHMHTRHLDARLHTLFVYSWDGKSVQPKWRGSRMARDFIDFVAVRRKEGDKILTLERLLDGRFTLGCYEWSGFGFRKQWERGHWKRARLEMMGPSVVEVVSEQGKDRFRVG